jgi:hypothetical protein
MKPQRLGVDGHEIYRRLRCVGFGAADLARIRVIAPSIEAAADEFTCGFFAVLSELSDARHLFQHPELLETAQRLKRTHLVDMVGGRYGREYVEDRLRLGQIYSGAGIVPSVFVGAYQQLCAALLRERPRPRPPAPSPARPWLSTAARGVLRRGRVAASRRDRRRAVIEDRPPPPGGPGRARDGPS